MKLKGLTRRPRLVVHFSVFVDALGSGVFTSGLTLFLVMSSGLDPRRIGIGLTVGALGGMLAAVPVAKLADRNGAIRTLALLSLMRSVVVGGYLLVDNTPMLICMAALLAIPTRAMPSVAQVVVRQIFDGAATTFLARIRVIRNGGAAIGSGLASTVVVSAGTSGFAALIMGSAACMAASGMLLYRLSGIVPSHRHSVQARGLAAVFDWRYMAIAGCNGVLALHVTALHVGLPLWAATRTDVPAGVVAGLGGVNAILVLLLQVRLSRSVNRLDRAAWFGTASGVLFLVAVMIVASFGVGAGRFTLIAGLILVVSLLTLAEIWQSSSAWIISDELAPENRRAEYIAAFSTGMALQQLAGPVLYGTVVIPLGALGWANLGIFVVAIALLYPRFIRAAQSRRPVNWSTRARRVTP